MSRPLYGLYMYLFSTLGVLWCSGPLLSLLSPVGNTSAAVVHMPRGCLLSQVAPGEASRIQLLKGIPSPTAPGRRLFSFHVYGHKPSHESVTPLP